MASWISSKLKVAENLLQQIDQQAAESLRHGDRKASDEDDLNFVAAAASPTSKFTPTLPLKDQFKKKPSSNLNTPSSSSSSSSSSNIVSHDITKPKLESVSMSNSKSPSTSTPTTTTTTTTTVNDTDWTELLSTPTKPIPSPSRRFGGKKPGNHNAVKPKPVSSIKPLLITPIKDIKDDSQAVGTTSLQDDHQLITNCNLHVVDSVSQPLKTTSLVSHSDSDSDSHSHSHSDSASASTGTSTSSSNSHSETKREEMIQKRNQILAAKVSQAIKEQENLVARLEGEKLSLERILQDRAKQAHQEASKLQSTTIETMEAADLEKQKHNHTRMEVLARLAKLETANADLAKSLANVQWNLEMEVNNVAELRRLVEAKELVHEELKRGIYTAHQTRTSLTSLTPYKGFELEREMLEDEVSFMTEKTAQLQEKATKLERDIDVILTEMESPTVVEVELKRRLHQLTDHLIQKQTQVEALSSEKATLVFRIEAVSSLLDENKSQINGGYISGSSREDVGGETYSANGPKLRILEHKIESGKQHLGSVMRQLDVVFYAGAQFLARNPAAKIWSLLYLVCLHIWVLYIVFTHSQSTDNSVSSSVVSLENINNNIGG